jgi:chromosome segregation protein
MYLKSLQLIGFKSFAEKTTLEFLPGVTAIVGPNGCGKSNIADAVRWVLGEQSAKALRGSEMADVIFNGADGRKAISMAEVNMTFADVDPKTLSLPGVNLDFNEITITRRVYRDGTGEYLINKTGCRLRDIQGLFMDTGIGRSSYSLMAQGQIDQILSAHPEDRRTIFEEAAGINKYKHQKKEALRKLEYTEANLVRITDIIKEVKRQIISLQRQAGKARRYKELFDQLKALDTRLARHRYDLFKSEISSLESQIADFAGKTGRFNAQITDHESQIAALRRSLSELERAINDAVGHDHELKNEGDRHQQRLSSNTERIVELEQLIANHHRETAGSEEKIRVQDQLLAALNAEFEKIDSTLVTEQACLEHLQEQVKDLDHQLSKKTAALTEANSALLALESDSARSRNELGALEHKKKHDLIRAERLSTEQLQLEEQRRGLQQRFESFNVNLTELRASVSLLRDSLCANADETAILAKEFGDVTRQHEAISSEVSVKAIRLELLNKMFAAPDGQTTLGQIIDVESQYGRAVEAALNHNLRTILTDSFNTARELLAGNVSVAAPEMCCTSAVPGATDTIGTRGTDTAPTNKVSAISFVRIRDARFDPLLHSLLANVAVAENLDAALALRSSQPSLVVATLAGEFIDEHGILSAVSASHIEEIASLSGETTRLQSVAAEVSRRKSELEQRKSTLNAESERLRSELHAREITLAGKEGELNAMTTEERDLDSKIHTVVFEQSAIEQQDNEERQRRNEILETLRTSETRAAELREQLGALQQAVQESQTHRTELFNALTEQRVAVGGIQHKHEAIEAQRGPIAGRVRDLRERMQTCRNEIVSYTVKIEHLRQENTESERKIAELAAAREESQAKLDGSEQQRSELANRIDHAETVLRALRQQASDTQQQKSSLDVARAQMRMEAQNLKERVAQKYQVNLEEVRGDTITITVADRGPVVSEAVPMPVDWDAIEAQVAEFQSRLDAMGPVNVEAINEFDELEERFKFLTQQHEDLVKAKDQLLQVIARINSTTKQLFSETFEKIRHNFQAMFTELFGGGKANLILLDENDPLESGIEIVAKPPGKQLQSITLLSGGERALTATALLFAVYAVKPSPFCVLDEIDAPLDESNINRFIRILQRFMVQSQFIVVSHNKRTIGMADALYGITMEEHGVSKVVSVKFSPREEHERKERERAREQQEDRIDGGAAVGSTFNRDWQSELPHEESLGNELLTAKDQLLTPVADALPIIVENASTISAAPTPIADELGAAVEAVKAANDSVEQIIDPEPPPA